MDCGSSQGADDGIGLPVLYVTRMAFSKWLLADSRQLGCRRRCSVIEAWLIFINFFTTL